jgi:hypothetical protein
LKNRGHELEKNKMMNLNSPLSKTSPLSTTSMGWRRDSEIAQSDWAEAVGAAATKLNAGWVLTDTKCIPTGLEEELAALCCAYGL